MAGAATSTSLKSFGDDVTSVRWVIVGVLSVGMIIACLSRSALSVPLALPEFIQSFHLSLTDRGLLNSAFFWTYAGLQIPAGWLVDRYGVKFPYFLGFTLWRLASASTALMRAIPQLILVQVLLGAGQAVVVPASLATGGYGTTSSRKSAAWR
jgi:MFS transporter, ACS family, D-galactonate transporter